MRRFVILASLVVLAVSAWLLTRTEGLPSRVDGDVAVAPPPASGEVPGDVTERGVVAAAGREVIEPWAGPFANVQVVAMGTNAPVAGAEVWHQPPEFDWAALAETELRELGVLRNHDVEAFLRKIGRATVTDAEGRCRVPLGKQGTAVVARAGERFGEGSLREGGPDPLVLVLRDDRTLRVRVVDAAGQAVPGIDVELRAPSNDGGTSRSSLGVSDASGVVTKPHAQRFAGDPTRKATVVATLPGGVGPSVEVDLLAPPAEVVLRLPATGSVTVRLLEASGAPLDRRYLAEAKVDLAGFDAEPADPASWVDGITTTRCVADLGVAGVAVFPRVALDRYLLVRLGPFLLEKGFVGPTHAKPAVEVTLQFPADRVVFVGRALGEEGAPCADLMLRLEYRAGGGVVLSGARTDAEGRFRWYHGPYSVHSVGKVATVSVATAAREPANPMAAEIPGRLVTKGDNDLGDVQLEPHRTLLGGRLVRGEGVDVAHWQVQMAIERRLGERWQADFRWQPEWQTDGTFAVRGVAQEGEPLRLVVRDGPFQPVPPIECAVGRTDIEIRLASAASATAVFLVDEGTPVGKLIVSFRRTHPAEPIDEASRMHRDAIERLARARAELDADGKFRRSWTGLTPGAYRLSVQCAGVAEPAAVLDDIRVGTGPCSDPRLLAIDLRGRLRRFEVRATGPQGQPIVDPEAFVVLYDAEGECQGYHLGRGVVDLVTTTAVDLRVWAPGHVLTLVPTVGEDCTIALQLATEVRFQVALPAALLEDVELRLRLVPQLGLSRRAHVTLDTGRGMSLDDLFVEHVVIGADGAGRLNVRWPGEHAVEARLARGAGSTYPIRDLTPRTVTLGATGAGGVVALSIGAAGFSSALERLRR